MKESGKEKIRIKKWRKVKIQEQYEKKGIKKWD